MAFFPRVDGLPTPEGRARQGGLREQARGNGADIGVSTLDVLAEVPSYEAGLGSESGTDVLRVLTRSRDGDNESERGKNQKRR